MIKGTIWLVCHACVQLFLDCFKHFLVRIIGVTIAIWERKIGCANVVHSSGKLPDVKHLCRLASLHAYVCAVVTCAFHKVLVMIIYVAHVLLCPNASMRCHCGQLTAGHFATS